MTTLHAPMLDAQPLIRDRSRVLLCAFIAICLASALAGRLVYLADPFGGDGAMFAYMGKLVTDGGRFGTDLIDNKFPTVGFITSPFWRAFGTWWPGYVIAQLILSLGAAAILARSAGRAFGEPARLATFLPAVVLMNLNAAVMGGFQLETIQTFFACLAAACAMESMTSRDLRPAFAAGLAAGCAVLVKPTGASVFLAMGIALFVTRDHTIKRYTAGITGFAIPLACGAWYLHASDQLRLLPEIARQIGEYSAGSSFNLWDLYRPLSLLFLFAAAMLIRGWVFRRRATEWTAGSQLWVFAIAWLALEFVGVLMQRRMYAYHFLPLAAPAALVFGALPRQVNLAQLAGVLAIPLALNAWGSADTLQQAEQTPPTWPAVTGWLDAHTLPGERVWRDQTMYVLLHSDLRPASRVQLTFLFMNSDTAPQTFGQMLIDDLKATRPRFIVLPADIESHIRVQTTGVLELARIPRRSENFTRAWRELRDAVDADYLAVKRIGDEMIWQRAE